MSRPQREAAEVAESDCDCHLFECGWCARFVVDTEEFCSPSCAEKAAAYDAQHAAAAPVPAPVVEVAPVALRRQDTVLFRVLAGVATVAVMVPITLVGIAVVTDEQPQDSAPVHRVVSTRCVDGLLVEGIDLGRADGMLLARTSEVSC